LKRAQAEGVVFSHPKEPAELQVPLRPSLKTRWNLSFALPLAAACLLIGGLEGGLLLEGPRGRTFRTA